MNNNDNKNNITEQNINEQNISEHSINDKLIQQNKISDNYNDNTIIIINTEDNNNLIDKPILYTRNYLYYLISITLCISFLILLCIIIFIIFTIIGLSTFNTNKLCPNSNLWYYVLTSLLIFIFSLLNYKINNSSDKYLCNIICYLIISSTLIIWGTYELFYITCVKQVSDTILYNISIIFWIYNISFCGINTGLLLGLILCSINIYNILSI